MKKTIKMMIIALLAFGMFSCGEKKQTYADMKKVEATLFTEDGKLDSLQIPKVEKKYVEFVKNNPNDSTAPIWLYHAMELNVMMNNTDKIIELCDQMTKQYPDSKWAPRGLYLLGSFVYEKELGDLDKAREIYDRILTDYPDSELIESVEASKKYLGWSPEKIMEDIAMKQFKQGKVFYSDSVTSDEE